MYVYCVTHRSHCTARSRLDPERAPRRTDVCVDRCALALFEHRSKVGRRASRCRMPIMPLLTPGSCRYTGERRVGLGTRRTRRDMRLRRCVSCRFMIVRLGRPLISPPASASRRSALSSGSSGSLYSVVLLVTTYPNCANLPCGTIEV